MSKEAMKEKMCPICHKAYYGYPAISRVDNKTSICPKCGQVEAIYAFMQFNNLIEKS